MKQVEVSLAEHSQPKGVKLNIGERKLSGLNWQGALNEKGVKQRLPLQ
jgi:hypothetical protein